MKRELSPSWLAVAAEHLLELVTTEKNRRVLSKSYYKQFGVVEHKFWYNGCQKLRLES